MAPRPAVDAVGMFRNALNPLNNWYSLLVFGIMGTFSTIIMTYTNLDMMRDRFQAQFYDTEDTFDFVIGKATFLFLFTLLRVTHIRSVVVSCCLHNIFPILAEYPTVAYKFACVYQSTNMRFCRKSPYI